MSPPAMTIRPAYVAALLAAAAMASAAAPRAPQASPQHPAAGGGLGLSSNGPIDVSADGVDNFHDEGRTVYKGNVEILQNQTRLRSPLVTLISRKLPSGAKGTKSATPNTQFGSLERIEAEGPVYYVTPQQQVKGDHGTYLADDDTITVTGNVTLVQGKDVMHGDKLVIEQKTGHSTMITNSPGKGPQRVRGVFFPSQPNGTGASEPASSKPGPAGG